MEQHHTDRALAVLRAVNRSLQLATDEQALLDDVCRIAIEVGGYRFSWIGFPVPDGEKSVRFAACAGHHSDYLDTIRISWGDNPFGRGPAGIAIREGRATSVRHITDQEEFAPWRAAALAFGYRSAISLPLSWRDVPFGCFTILSAEADAFDAVESDLLSELSASLSYGIHALRTAREREAAEANLRTERDVQKTLRLILSLALEELPLEAKLDRTLELLFDVPWLKFERKGSIFLVDEETQSLRLVAKRHLSPLLQERCGTVPLDRCLCGKAVKHNELLFRAHVDGDHETRFDGIRDHGHYCVPIRASKGAVGLLNLYVSAGHVPAEIEAPFLSAVADTLAGLIEREQAQMAQQRLATILEATPDLVSITDVDGTCLYRNEGARQVHQAVAPGTTDSDSIYSHYPPEMAQRMRNEVVPQAIAAGLWEGEMMLRGPEGGEFPVSQTVMAHRDAHGEAAYLSFVARDISDRKRAEEAMRAIALRETNFANSLINGLPGIFYLTDGKGALMRWNSNLETLLGYEADALQTLHVRELIKASDWPKMERTCRDIATSGHAAVEVALMTCDGRAIPFYISITRVERPDTGPTVVCIGIDISYRHQLERELREQATTDALTQVFNRLKVEQVLETELKRCERHGAPLSIAMFDIDHFKRVNDSFGHDVGDKVLQRVAEVCRRQLREIDLLGRWGGEEFMIVASTTTLGDMGLVAERVREAIARELIDPVGHVSASFGIGQYRPGESRKALLKRVDDALYRAKQAGRNRSEAAE